MRSIVLCEGPDDRWFIGYYLHKMTQSDGNWNHVKPKNNGNIPGWSYKIEDAIYMKNNAGDTAAIWGVGGKDAFEQPLRDIFEDFIQKYRDVDTVVIVRDRDEDTTEDALCAITSWLPKQISLTNGEASVLTLEEDGELYSVSVVPMILPCDEAGAIETLLMNAIREQSLAGELVVQGANGYIDSMLNCPEIEMTYLHRRRSKLKSRYASVVAVTNPDHSTGQFQDLVMNCPWEKSAYVQKHLEPIRRAITSQ